MIFLNCSFPVPDDGTSLKCSAVHDYNGQPWQFIIVSECRL